MMYVHTDPALDSSWHVHGFAPTRRQQRAARTWLRNLAMLDTEVEGFFGENVERHKRPDEEDSEPDFGK